MKSEIKKTYYQNGKIRSKSYYKKDQLHRENGPAYIRYYQNGKIESESYYIKGEEITDDFQILVIQGLGIKL